MKVSFALWSTELPPLWVFLLPLYHLHSERSALQYIKNPAALSETPCALVLHLHFFCMAAEKTFHDCCQHQSLSHHPNNIGPVSVLSWINCIGLPTRSLRVSQADHQSERLRDENEGSGGRWEVTGEPPRWMVEWRCDVSPGTSMTYSSRERGEDGDGGCGAGGLNCEEREFSFPSKTMWAFPYIWLLAPVSSVFPSASDSQTSSKSSHCVKDKYSVAPASSGGAFVKVIEVRGGSNLV